MELSLRLNYMRYDSSHKLSDRGLWARLFPGLSLTSYFFTVSCHVL